VAPYLGRCTLATCCERSLGSYTAIATYMRLEADEKDVIVEDSSGENIVLLLGCFLVACGGVLEHLVKGEYEVTNRTIEPTEPYASAPALSN
jgi:hypothetical protein